MRRKSRAHIVLLLSTMAGRALAQPPASYESVVSAPPEGAFVTVIDAKEPSARVASVADLVERQAGVLVRSRGGLGAFTSVSIRGSEANEVAILIDGVPLTRSAMGVVDLAMLPVAGLERVEIYRGAPPVELGSEAVGGAINLITRRGTRRELRASAGAGSFGARSVMAGISDGSRRFGGDLSVSYHGATGDFRYYDTAGTLINHSDDHVTIRRNNDFDQLALQATLHGSGPIRWRASAHGFLKLQGVPGLGIAGGETTNARLSVGRVLADTIVLGARGRVDWRAGAHALFERTAFANPLGERVGPFGPSVTDGEAVGGGLSGRLGVRLPYQLLAAHAETRVEHRTPYNLLAPHQAWLPSTRVLGAVSIADDLRLARDRLLLSAALRLDGLHSRVSRDTGTSEDSSVFVSPRLTVRAQVTRWLELKGSAGRFVRFPTLLELFGDGAFVLPRPLLRPETSWGGDAGAALSLAGRRAKGFVEAAFFGRYVSDTIAYVTGGNAASAMNVGDARVLGGELRAQLSAYLVTARVDYTILFALNESAVPGARGKQLPGRPRHEVNVRLQLDLLPFRAFYDLSFVDAIYRDPQNLAAVPGRVLHAVGLSFDPGWLVFSLEVRNLADLRVIDLPLGGSAQAGRTVPYPLVDYFNYPLPGRAIYATVTLRR